MESEDDRRIAARIEDHARSSAHRAFAATNPIFEILRGRRTCTASCVLLQLGTRVAIVTASHAIIAGRKYEFGAHNEILPVAGSLRRTIPPTDASTSTDLVDLAVILLPEEVASQVDPTLPISPEELDTLERPLVDPIYLALGFPYTRQSSHRFTGANAATNHSFLLSRGKLSRYPELGLDPMTTLVLGFNKHEVYRDGQLEVAPDPVGMSGGGVWLLPPLGSSTAGGAKLAGILIEWRKGPQRLMLATRAHAAFRLLLELDPGLSSAMPPLRFGSAT